MVHPEPDRLAQNKGVRSRVKARERCRAARRGQQVTAAVRTLAKLDSADAHGDLQRERRHVRVGDRGDCGAALFGRGVREHRVQALRQRRGEGPVELLALCAHKKKKWGFGSWWCSTHTCFGLGLAYLRVDEPVGERRVGKHGSGAMARRSATHQCSHATSSCDQSNRMSRTSRENEATAMTCLICGHPKPGLPLILLRKRYRNL